MRKFGYTQSVDEKLFRMVDTLYLLNEATGKYELIDLKQTVPDKLEKYTKKQQLAIIFVNNSLEARKQEPLTVEEIDHMFDPVGAVKGMKEFDDKVKTVADLQRLAGFTVEKTIIQHND